MKRTRRALAVCLMICMLLSMPGITFAKVQDVEGHWAEGTINIWVEKGLIRGFPDGNFKPENPMTRAEFFVLLNKCFGFYKTASSDVPDNALAEWFTEDLSIAEEQGYLEGLPEEMLKPNEPISRQEVVAILGKVMKLISDESAAGRFADADLFASWARGYIGAATNLGYIKGYTDNTFRPEKNISRAEVVTVLHRSIGELYNAMGTFGPETSTTTITGNSTISKPNVVLRNQIIEGNLYLTEGIGEGTVTLDQVTVLGTTIVSGGGKGIVIKDASIGEVVVKGKNNPMVHLVAQGTSKIGTVHVQSNTKLEEYALKGTGFGEVILEAPEGGQLILAGDFDRGELKAPLSQLSILKGTIKQLQNNAKDAVIEVDKSVRIDTLTIDQSLKITGKFSLGTVNINASNVYGEATPEIKKQASGLSNVIFPDPLILSGGGGGGGGTTPAVTVASIVAIGNKTVLYGTSKEAIGLQTTIEVTLSDGNKEMVDVTWNNGTPAYDGNIVGDYTFTGTLTTPKNVINPGNLKATVKVTVEAPVPAAIKVTKVNIISDILLEQGTVSESVYLAPYFPQEVGITLSNGKSLQVSVSWNYNETPYDGDKAAVYTFWGGLSLPDDVTNPDNLKAHVLVIVGEPVVVPVSVIKVGELKDIEVKNGTVQGAIPLPTQVEVTFSNGTKESVTVVWSSGTPAYDGTTAGTYPFIGTLPSTLNNPGELKASVNVIVGEPVVIPVTVTKVTELPDIEVKNGTTQGEIPLPAQVEVTFSNDTKESVTVVWSSGTPAYDGTTAGTYPFIGTLPSTLNNPGELKASVNVIVGTSITVKSVDAIKDRIVIYDTDEAHIGLPRKIGVTLSNNEKVTVNVTWVSDTYNSKTPGSYTFTGTLNLSDGVTISNNLIPSVMVTVYKGSNPNPNTPLNTSPGTTIYEFDNIEDWWDAESNLLGQWWNPNGATLQRDERNRISGSASTKFIPKQPDFEEPVEVPKWGGDTELVTYGHYSGISRGDDLGDLMQNMDNIEFNIYIPENKQVEWIEVKFFSDIHHNLYFKNGIGDYELTPGWNKIRRTREDFSPVPAASAYSQEETSTMRTMSLKSTIQLSQEEILQQKMDILNKLIMEKRNQKLLEQIFVEDEAIDGMSSILEEKVVEEDIDEGIVEAALNAPSWDYITRMEFQVVFRDTVFKKDNTVPSVNIDKVAFNTRGKAKLLFTFDDAWYDVIENGKPILDEKGFKGTVWVNKDEAVGQWYNPRLFMNVSDLNKIYEEGWDIGNHTDTHPDDISKLTDLEALKEYSDNQDWIEENLWFRGARHVCYPSGSYNDNLVELLQGIGVKSGRTTVYGITPTPVTNMYKLKCVAIGKDVDLEKHVLYEIQRAVETGSTLFFMLHRVTDVPNDAGEEYAPITISTSKLREIVEYADRYVKSGQLEVVTISEWFESYLGNETYTYVE